MVSSDDSPAQAGSEVAAAGARLADRSAPEWGAHIVILSVATVIVSLGNYAFSLAILHLLPADEYTVFAAAQSLLLVIGSGVMAAIPWAMARYIALSEGRTGARRQALHFGFSAASVQALIAAIITVAIVLPSGGGAPALVAALGAVFISFVIVPVGFLQGIQELRTIAYIRLLEVAVRVATATMLVILVRKSSALALAGFPVGSAVLLAVGLFACRSGFPPEPGNREIVLGLMRQSVSLGAIQLLLSMLAALDSVAAPVAGLGSINAASYQAAALLGRVPLFLSASLGTAAYTQLVTPEHEEEVRQEMSHVIYTYLLVAAPYVAICWTVPASLLHLLIPVRFGTAPTLLKFTATSGLGIGWIDIISTAHQARGRFRRAVSILSVGAVAQPLALIGFGRWLGLWWFAAALVAVTLLTVIALTIDGRHWIRIRMPRTHWLAFALGALALYAARGTLIAWLGLALSVSVIVFLLLIHQARASNATEDVRLFQV